MKSLIKALAIVMMLGLVGCSSGPELVAEGNKPIATQMSESESETAVALTTPTSESESETAEASTDEEMALEISKEESLLSGELGAEAEQEINEDNYQEALAGLERELNSAANGS